MTTTVNVVIVTHQRPDRLRRALLSLQAASTRLPGDWSVGVTVVDDDPAGSAAPVAADFAAAFPAGCDYRSCGSQNISIARNSGLDAAVPHADWVGSIDDDVEVPVNWFEVSAAAVGSSHTAVTGPLLKDFSLGPAWLSEQPFAQLGILAGTDGEETFTCATGNNWVSGEFLRRYPTLRFSPELGTSGGEDMDFFYRAVELGLSPVYSLGSAVTEKEPAERCTMRYQLRRAYWLGISEAQISLKLGRASRARLVARAVRRALNRGAAQLPPETLTRRGRRYEIVVLAQCLGLVLGTLGARLRHK